MPVMDEFREEREALKHGTWKQKLSYFIYYYKWHVIIGVAALAMIISLAAQILSRKEPGFYAALLNAGDFYDTTAYLQSFAEYADIDLKENDLIFDTSMIIEAGQLDQNTIASTQRLMVYIAAAELDVMVTDASSIQEYANGDYFFDLRDILTPEQVERYEPYFYYVDLPAVQARKEALENFEEENIPSYPDPRHPENMEQPIPVGICLEGENALKENFYFSGDMVVVTVFQNTTRLETAVKFIDFLMQ